MAFPRGLARRLSPFMKNLVPQEAYEFLRKNPGAILFDIRSEIEHYFVGHPVGAIHVAWSDGPDWQVDPRQFVSQIKATAATDRPVVLICRSGNRTIDAGLALEAAGYTKVYNVVHGFEGDLGENNHRNEKNGWRHDGLPWEQT